MENETVMVNDLPFKSVKVTPGAHQKAVIASGIRRQSMKDFLTEAIERLADPVLRKHGMDPEKVK